MLSFGAHALPHDYLSGWETQEQRNREMLSHALNLGDMIVFVGAGCSIPRYPSWKMLATEHAIQCARGALTAADLSRDLKSRCEGRLQDIEARITRGHGEPKVKKSRHSKSRRALAGKSAEAPAVLSVDDYTFILGACEKICQQAGCSREYRKRIAALFEPRNGGQVQDRNPHDFLASLRVHRFITSNYDCELEEALIRKKGLAPEDYLYRAMGFGKKSFAQTVKYDEQLAAFSIAFAGFEPMVFHCHGWHHESDSMVLTEDDYQDWYFRDQAIGGRYRQTIDLIFNSNPLLFIGFSLSDDDLLIPLRFLSSVDRENKYSRPIFALLERSHINNESRFYQLYERYGIHALTYSSPGESTNGRVTALCDAIKNIAESGRLHRKEWLEKPAQREARPKSGTRFLHYYPTDAPEILEPERDDPLELWDLKKDHVLWILGPAGSGKSWAGIRQLEQLARDGESGFKKLFFWSFRYSNDAQSGIEYALRFLNEDPGPAEGLLDQLFNALRHKRNLVVFDGVERFLHQNVTEGTIVAANSTWEKLFAKLAANAASLKGVLILISRTLPTMFLQDSIKGSGDGIGIQELRGLSTCQIAKMLAHVAQDPARWADLKVPDRICSWFRGHRYGVTLAAKWLQEHTFDDLQFEMAEADPEHRVSKMIGLSLKDIRERREEAGKCAYQLMERLAAFVEPVGIPVAQACKDPIYSNSHFNDAIKLLKDRKLVFEVVRHDGTHHYMIHPSMREYIFYHDHHASPAALPSFALSGFTSDVQTVYPGDRQSNGKRTIMGLLESMLKKAPAEPPESRVALCRAAFGVVRSRMVATTVSRWSRYEEYVRLLIQVMDLVRCNSWCATEPGSNRASAQVNSTAALYADELAWLYNETGLAYYSQGSIVDAIAVWEQSYEFNKILDGDGIGHHTFQSLCNLGGAYIHFGRLRKADLYLQKAIEMGRRLGDKGHMARIGIYLALLCHLRGNFTEANKRYTDVTQELSHSGNMRAYSIALRHHADLLLKQEATRPEAWEKIQTSKAISEANSYHDLAAYSRLSYGHLYRLEKKFPDAIREYRVALDLARNMGLRRLEAEAQSELARVDLDLGDSHVARRRAMKALQIANENLLGLRQTHCLVMLGKATINAGERELGVHYLRYAKHLADTQEYRLRASEAEAALHEIGEPIEDSAVERSFRQFSGR